MIAGPLRPVGEVEGIHADTVAPDKPRSERQKIPLRPGCREHIVGIEVERSKDLGELVDEGDVEVSLGVLDDLRGLGDPDRRRFMNSGADHRPIHLGHDLRGLGGLG